MYLSHWGLKASPFRANSGANAFFHAPSHEEALARLQFVVDHGYRVGLLTGPEGSGKSLLLDVFGRQLWNAGSTVIRTSAIGREPQELLWEISKQLGKVPSANASQQTLWQYIEEGIAENHLQQIATLFLLDDAEFASDTLQPVLERLLDAEGTIANVRWTIILATNEEGCQHLSPRILSRAALRVSMAPWQPEETASFLESTLKTAGISRNIWQAQAIEKLYALTNGVPRDVKRLADLALVAGACKQLETLDSETVEDAAAELAVV